MARLKIIGIQMLANGQKRQNLSKILHVIDQAVAEYNRPDFVVLPEYCYHVPVPEDVAQAAESIPGDFSEAMSAKAREHGVYLVAGSFPEKAAGGKIHNTCLFFDRQGRQVGVYRKIHLMDGMSYKESDSVERGDSIPSFETEFGRVGVMVCYDLRFPEIARTLALEGAKILFVPAAFPSGTALPPRTDHWDVLVRSTALLNSLYVVAVNQYGSLHTDHYFGRTLAVDPWGTCVAQAAAGETILFATLDLDHIEAVRAKLPTFSHRRPELYRM